MRHGRIVGVLSLAAALGAGCGYIRIVPVVDPPTPANGSPAAPAPVPPTAPPVVDPPAPVPPVVTPPVVEPTPADPAPAPAPERDLELFVLDGAGAAIPAGKATIPATGEVRTVSDGSGRIHFPVRGPVVVEVSAPGYLPQTRDVPPGRHNVNLVAVAPPAPVVVPGPSHEPTKPVPAPTEIRPGLVSIRQIAAIAEAVHNAEGWDIGGASSRETRNRFWERVIGIVHFGHTRYNLTADPRWHVKDGGNGRPMSDDVAVLMPDRLFFDCIPNAGAGQYNAPGGYRFDCHGGERLPAEQNVYPPRRPQ